jgi:hypothetical protein
MGVLFTDSFTRADSNTVGNGWTETETSANVCTISSNQLSINASNDSSGPSVVQTLGSVPGMPVSISFTTTPNGSNASARFLYFYLFNSNRNISISWKPNNNSAANTVLYGDGLSKGSTQVDFTVKNWIWIDLVANGSNCDVALYIAASSSKPGSATLSTSNVAIPSGSDFGFLFDATSSHTQASVFLDDFSLSGTAAYTLALAQMSYALTLETANLAHGYIFPLTASSFSLTYQPISFSIFQRWLLASKHTSSFTDASIHSSSWSDQSKHSSTFADQAKS